MKVLFVTACVGRGGAGHSLHYLCQHLDRDTVVPSVVMPTEGVIGPKLREIGVPVFVHSRLRERFYELRFVRNNPVTRALSVLRNALDSVIFVFYLSRLARKLEADVIYANQMMVKVICAAAGVLSRKPVLFHCRTIYSNALERWLYVSAARLPNVRRVIAVSNASADNFRAVSNKVRVVHNGVPIQQIVERSHAVDVRAEFNIPQGQLLLGFVGRFVPWKGVDVLLDAARILKDRGVDSMLMLVGDVPAGSKETIADYQEKIRGRDLDDRVMLTGFQPDPAPFLAAFDTLVVPSISPDPCPRVVVEAMALGTVVIGSNAGGIPEVVEHEVSGLLVPPNDADALASQVIRIWEDEDLRARLSQTAAEDTRRDYDASMVAGKIQDILIDALQPT